MRPSALSTKENYSKLKAQKGHACKLKLGLLTNILLQMKT